MIKSTFVRNIVFVSLTTALLCLTLICYKYYNEIGKMKNERKDLSLELRKEKIATRMLRENLKLNCSITESFLKDFKLYIDNDTSFFSQHLQFNRTVFFFSQRHCQQCIETELKNIINSPNKDDILILTDIKRQKYLNILKEIGNNQLKIYCTDFDYGELNVSKYHSPFYFKVNKNLKLLSSFFPERSRADISYAYLLE